jgi:hypothetical protein
MTRFVNLGFVLLVLSPALIACSDEKGEGPADGTGGMGPTVDKASDCALKISGGTPEVGPYEFDLPGPSSFGEAYETIATSAPASGHASVLCLHHEIDPARTGAQAVISQSKWSVYLKPNELEPFELDESTSNYVVFEASFSYGLAAPDGRAGHDWACLGGAGSAGTFEFDVTSVQPVRGQDGLFAIRGTGHAQCPASSPDDGTLTIDVTF